jgi:hypothetical protein
VQESTQTICSDGTATMAGSFGGGATSATWTQVEVERSVTIPQQQYIHQVLLILMQARLH